MKFSYYIDKGVESAGGVEKLADHLGVDRTIIPKARAGKRGLPVPVCYILAKLIDEDPARVVAASELVTEKKEERRAALLPFVQERKAAAWLIAIAFGAIIGTAAPSPAQAAPSFMQQAYPANVYYVQLRRAMRRYQIALCGMFSHLLKPAPCMP